MKKLFALFIFLFSISLANAQEVAVTTNKPELQTGLLGIWLNKEYRLSDQIAIELKWGWMADFGGIRTPRDMHFFRYLQPSHAGIIT